MNLEPENTFCFVFLTWSRRSISINSDVKHKEGRERKGEQERAAGCTFVQRE